jgi:hypothetical protein
LPVTRQREEQRVARYFFHLRDGVDLCLDQEGRELGTLKDISAAALKDARSIISEDVKSGYILLDRHIDVEDESGRVVHRLEFVASVSIVMPAK